MGIRLTTKVDKISMKKYYLNIIKDKDQRIAELEKELAELKEKDNYHLRYELAGADETITNLKKQLEEKDKEIERLKTKQKPIVMHSKEDYFKRCNFLEEENIKLQFAQTKLAIQELEKTLNFIEDVFDKALKNCSLNNGYYDQILDFIDQQINELKRVKRRK